MQPPHLDRWIWTLIYGGMIGGSLGWFVAPHGGPWGELLVAAGLAAMVGGVADRRAFADEGVT
jgi:hypothetical protein